MLALDAKIEQITEADQGALQKPQDQEDKVSIFQDKSDGASDV